MSTNMEGMEFDTLKFEKRDPLDSAIMEAQYLNGSPTYRDITDSVTSVISILLSKNSPREKIIRILSAQELISSIDTSHTNDRSHGDTTHLTGLSCYLREVIKERSDFEQ